MVATIAQAIANANLRRNISTPLPDTGSDRSRCPAAGVQSSSSSVLTNFWMRRPVIVSATYMIRPVESISTVCAKANSPALWPARPMRAAIIYGNQLGRRAVVERGRLPELAWPVSWLAPLAHERAGSIENGDAVVPIAVGDVDVASLAGDRIRIGIHSEVRRIVEKRLALVGASVGAGVAAYVASRRPVAGELRANLQHRDRLATVFSEPVARPLLKDAIY